MVSVLPVEESPGVYKKHVTETKTDCKRSLRYSIQMNHTNSICTSMHQMIAVNKSLRHEISLFLGALDLTLQLSFDAFSGKPQLQVRKDQRQRE